MTTIKLLPALLLAASLAACATAEDTSSDVRILERADAAPAPADAPVEPTEPTGPIAAEYGQISGTTGLYQAEMDAEGNDAVMMWGDLATDDPTATLYLEMYEGWGHFTDGEGAAVSFGQLALPDVIEIGDNERDYAVCGTCLSIFVGLDAGWTTYDKQLLAQSGSIELTQVATAPGMPFSATLHDVTFAEVDDYGLLVEGGETAHVTAMVVAAMAAAE